jgi:hypothetical protein
MKQDSSAFTARPVGTTGHEILAPDGKVVAWTVNDYWAAVVVDAMNRQSERQAVDDHLGFGGIDMSPDVSPPSGT